jgi:peptide/nickel transport system permease protein
MVNSNQAKILAQADQQLTSKRLTFSQIAIGKFRQSPTGMIGLTLVTLVVMVALLVPILAPYSATQTHVKDRLKGPSAAYPLGTDELGRDLLSRAMFGSQLALASGLITVGLAFAIGVPLGMVSGFRKGWIDNIIMRCMDGLSSFPPLVLAIAITAALGFGARNALIAIAVTYIPTFARLARGQVLSEQEELYIEAARCIGASDLDIMFRHILRNIMSPLVVQASLLISASILAEASLSFLGIGNQPPAPSWGFMLNVAIGYLQNNLWMSIVPGVALFITVLGFNFLGDGLRDALDPTTTMTKK